LDIPSIPLPQQIRWVPIDVHASGDQPIGVVYKGDTRFLVISGDFNLHPHPYTGLYSEEGYGIWINYSDADTKEALGKYRYQPPMRVPSAEHNVSVTIQVIDKTNAYGDNWSKDLQAGLSKPSQKAP
jgi:hypothetical protein